jgi:AcrR family transcriptional regulator
MTPGDTAERPLRKDAERNRERLLTAASEVFAQRGLDVTMHDIAAHAGVGVGTAYRRFANKQEVIEALFEQRLDKVAALADEALDDPNAWRGLCGYLERVLRLQSQDRGLTDIVNNPDLGQDRADEARDRIGPRLQALVDRARQQGHLRPDFDATDIVLIQFALGALMDRTRTVEPDLYRRYLTMFLDGIRADRKTLTDLPVDPLRVDATQAVMRPGGTNAAKRSST